MLKILGAVMICAGSAAVGMRERNRLSIRVSVLQAWLNVFDIMQSEIEFLLTPIDELIEKCFQNTTDVVKKFFSECIAQMKAEEGLPIKTVWLEALNRADYMELTGQQKGILSELGKTLGRYDARDQVQAIKNLRRCLETCYKDAQYEKVRLGKLYGSLGVFSGIALVIVFF